MTGPTVSVCMITYNHAAFIRQAVESVLMQQTDFEYELVIGEDCSTDETRQILLSLAASDRRIRLLAATQNLGMHANTRRTFIECDGEFVAFLEGDDFWDSPLKLRTQVQAMRRNPLWSGCFHQCNISDERTVPPKVTKSPAPELSELTLSHLLRCNSVMTASMLARREMCEYPKWSEQLAMVDWSLWILLTLNGPIGYLHETMATYRIHGGGVWGPKSPVWQIEQCLKIYDVLEQNCGRIPTQLLRDARNAAITSALQYAATLEANNRQLLDDNMRLNRVGVCTLGAQTLSRLTSLVRRLYPRTHRL